MVGGFCPSWLLSAVVRCPVSQSIVDWTLVGIVGHFCLQSSEICSVVVTTCLWIFRV